MVRLSFAVKAGFPISRTSHSASQADGKSKLEPCGEINVTLNRGKKKFTLDAIVVKNLDCDVLVGMPFLKFNGIVLDFPSETIVIDGEHYISYSQKETTPRVRRLQTESFLLRAKNKEILLPGEFLELEVPHEITEGSDIDISVVPRSDSLTPTWPDPDIVTVVGGHIRIPNSSTNPVVIRKNQHICQTYFVEDYNSSQPTNSRAVLENPATQEVRSGPTKNHPGLNYAQSVILDPDNKLSGAEKQAFKLLHEKYDEVFNPEVGCYNDASGKIRASINFGMVEPPVQKGRLPAYNRNSMCELQEKMDQLESLGVLAKPEDVGIIVEHVSPSFLVRKPNGGSRLVTAFTSLSNYAKPPPSRVVTCDDVLRFLAEWKYIIKTDMTSQFFQLPMKRASMKYLGVMTPYKGVRVYTRAAMGMPGSTEHLDELITRVLGELLHEGSVMKLADDLYVGGDNMDSLLRNWEQVLYKFQTNCLRLSPTKTEICPATTNILGWVWSEGNISISPHKLSPLANCGEPKTVKGLRSWIGAYKHLKACIPKYSSLLSKLEAAVAGRESREHLTWSGELSESFEHAQQALRNPKTITIPKSSDQLVITSDGAVSNGGIGSVLYILRKGNVRLGGYFSAKLKPHQQKWLPCEIEALAISSAINHWAPYILESKHQSQILSDSKPCVQSFQKLQRGQFSSSARVSTFLGTLSRYNIKLQHIAGTDNLPADYLSRSPMECKDSNCQVCKFIAEADNPKVCSITVSDVLQGKVPMPYTTGNTWKNIQQNCNVLRRVYSHLTQGTRPTKKMSNIKNVKRYLQVSTIGPEGVLVVNKPEPFTGNRQLIVVPQDILAGLISALHLQLQHPSKSQLQKVFHRYFYALDSDSEIMHVTSQCHQCAALRTLPQEVNEFTTSLQSPIPGSQFACDVMRRSRQKIMVIRDTLTSYTMARIIPNEQANTLRSAIIETTADLKSAQGATIRVDGATSFQALLHDPGLESHGLSLQMGRLKNVNKNPVAEKGVQELEIELRKRYPDGRSITPSELAVTVATLNSRIRSRGLSAKEILHQRDNITGEKLNLKDSLLAQEQLHQRLSNHAPSAKSKAPKGGPATKAPISPGDLVYIKGDGDKHKARDRYLVTDCDDTFVTVHKLIGSQFRSRGYQLKYSEVYKVPCASPLAGRKNSYIQSCCDDSDSSDEANHLSISAECHEHSVLDNYSQQEDGLVSEDLSDLQQLEYSDEPSDSPTDLPAPMPSVPTPPVSSTRNYIHPSGEPVTSTSNGSDLEPPAANTRAQARRRMEPHAINNSIPNVTELNQKVPNSHGRARSRPTWMNSKEWEL